MLIVTSSVAMRAASSCLATHYRMSASDIAERSFACESRGTLVELVDPLRRVRLREHLVWICAENSFHQPQSTSSATPVSVIAKPWRQWLARRARAAIRCAGAWDHVLHRLFCSASLPLDSRHDTAQRRAVSLMGCDQRVSKRTASSRSNQYARYSICTRRDSRILLRVSFVREPGETIHHAPRSSDANYSHVADEQRVQSDRPHRHRTNRA